MDSLGDAQCCLRARQATRMSAKSSLCEFYVAVAVNEDKMVTLLELLEALQAQHPVLALTVCCGSRDSLDAVVHNLMRLKDHHVSALYSDMTVAELEFEVGHFKRQVAAHLHRSEQPGATPRGAADPFKGAQPGEPPTAPAVLVLVTTDVCLKALPKEALPLGVPLLLQFDLPQRKDVYIRRVYSAFGGGKERKGNLNVVVDLFAAYELPQFRQLEGFSSCLIQEMPVHVPDMLLGL